MHIRIRCTALDLRRRTNGILWTMNTHGDFALILCPPHRTTTIQMITQNWQQQKLRIAYMLCMWRLPLRLDFFFISADSIKTAYLLSFSIFSSFILNLMLVIFFCSRTVSGKIAIIEYMGKNQFVFFSLAYFTVLDSHNTQLVWNNCEPISR